MKRVLLIGFAVLLFGFAGAMADGQQSQAYALSSERCLVGTTRVCSEITTKTCLRWVRMLDWGHMVYWFCWKWMESTDHYYWSTLSSGGGGSSGDHPLNLETHERAR